MSARVRSPSIRAIARPARGFTLLEVVIALAVVAIALLGLVSVAGISANTLSHERMLTLGTYVAANVLAESDLRDPFPGIGRRDGTMRMGDREFRWVLDVQGTPEPSIRRLDVTVFDAGVERGDAPVASMTGFASAP